MKKLSEMNIRDIELLTETEVQEIAKDTYTFKGYMIYFVDFGGYFGFSRLVFKNGAHIYYANDYALHHAGKTEIELQKMYIDTLDYKLFTFEDMQKVISYEDYERKNYWIRNYFPQEFEHYSIFCIQGSEEDKNLEKIKSEKKLYLSNICFCYFADVWPVEMAKKLLTDLDKAKEEVNSLDYWVQAFEHELFNHEYLINLQGNWDVFSCFGNVEYKGDELEGMAEIVDYMKQLGIFDKMHLDAFKQAYNNYYEVAQNY